MSDVAHESIEIKSNDGCYNVIFDTCDIELIQKHYWHIWRSPSHDIKYAATAIYGKNGKRTYTTMHRLIMLPPPGLVTDHINRNGLDNRRCNLRIATHSQNNANKAPMRGKTASVYKGVSKTPYGKWQAMTRTKGKELYLGTFESEIDAAKAYDKKVFELHGEFAYLNFPEAPKEISG